MSNIIEKQTEEIKQQIKESENNQNLVINSSKDSVSSSLSKLNSDITFALNQNTFAIAASASFLEHSFNNGFNKVNNTVNLGFNKMNSEMGKIKAGFIHGFESINSNIDNWGNKLVDKLDIIEKIVDNPILTKSRELYRMGFASAKKKFFPEAIEYLQEAISLNKTDYISYGLLGKIYLFGESNSCNVIDYKKALDTFENACKYILPETDNNTDICQIAAELYFYFGYVNYLLSFNYKKQKRNELLSKSIVAFKQSFTFSNEMYESLFLQSKVLYLLGDEDSFFSAMKELISIDRLYILKYLNDEDLIPIELKISNYITSLRDDSLKSLREKSEYLMANYYFLTTSFSQKVLSSIVKISKLKDNIPFLDLCEYAEDFLPLYETIICDKVPYDFESYKSSFTNNLPNKYLAKYFLPEVSSKNEKNTFWIFESDMLISNDGKTPFLGFRSTPKIFMDTLEAFHIILSSYGNAIVNVVYTSNQRENIDLNSLKTFSNGDCTWQLDNNTLFILEYNLDLEINENGTSIPKEQYTIYVKQKSIILKTIYDTYKQKSIEDFPDLLSNLEKWRSSKNSRIISLAKVLLSHEKKLYEIAQTKDKARYYANERADTPILILENKEGFKFTVTNKANVSLSDLWEAVNIVDFNYRYEFVNNTGKVKISYKDAKNYLSKIQNNEEIKSILEQCDTLHSQSFQALNGGGCYIATCVYGSYDCPQVWTLRRYRDLVLSRRWYGKLFINLYYYISPKFVKLFGATQWFRKLVKPKLDSLVKKLQKDGIENTPYKDINP